ncbi:MAG TPA: hypothetical protein VJ672_02920 [Gemmatimonadaceae bacterium]|nr:hypothetical protein [Gemmatimonadaceae bacterium]
MASHRRGIRRVVNRTIACGPDDCAPRPATAPADPAAPARVVNLAGGTKWLATLVARLNSQDLENGASSTRLILRFESLTDPDRQPRIHSVNADSLEEMDESVLRTLVSRPSAKARRSMLLRGRREAESGD